MPRDHFHYDLTCSCGATGTAHGTDDDNGPNFTIDETSAGFRESGSSRSPSQVFFRHQGCSGSVTWAWAS